MSGILYFKFNFESTVDRVELNDINDDITLKELKEKVSQAGKCQSEDIELIFRGNTLNDESTLKNVGVRPGVTIFVFKKVKKEQPKKSTKADIDVHALSAAFKKLLRFPAFSSAYKLIRMPSNLQNIIIATPELRNDPVSLAIIQDPDLLMQMCDIPTLRRIIEKHPALAEAAMHIVSVIIEEAMSTSSSLSHANYPYPLENLSEDEDMESNSSDSQHPGESSSITSMQLAAALAAAQSQATSSSTNASAESSNSLITSQMLGQALGQAFASSSVSQPSTAMTSTPNAPASESDLVATSRRLGQHLAQMHEMGLRDDVINLQALQATDWNVQEAINLVFSGGMTDNDVE